MCLFFTSNIHSNNSPTISQKILKKNGTNDRITSSYEICDIFLLHNGKGSETMLRVFEAFSGVGAQHMALRNIGKEFEIVATSDIDENAILAYYYVHCNFEKVNKDVNKKEIIDYLLLKGISTQKKLANKPSEDLEELYNASIISKNLGDITKIDINNIPDHDLFTYSFPCQDISSVGTRKGLDSGSGTRSSLLWECKRIIENKKPKYLLLENVKNLTTGKHKENFLAWLDYLEKQGYDNSWDILDAKDYGIPQRRPRTIVVSKLEKSDTDLLKTNQMKTK